MLLEFLLAAVLSTPAQVEQDYDTREAEAVEFYENYIDYQIHVFWTPTHQTVEFIRDIPQKYHDKIREDLESAGWSVSIERYINPACQYIEYYKFTVTKK